MIFTVIVFTVTYAYTILFTVISQLAPRRFAGGVSTCAALYICPR